MPKRKLPPRSLEPTYHTTHHTQHTTKAAFVKITNFIDIIKSSGQFYILIFINLSGELDVIDQFCLLFEKNKIKF